MEPSEGPDPGRREPADLPETQAMPIVEHEVVEDRVYQEPVYEDRAYQPAVVDESPRAGWPIVLGLLVAVGLIILVIYLMTARDDTPVVPTAPSSTVPTTAAPTTRPGAVTTARAVPAPTVRVTTTLPATTSSSSTSSTSTSTSTTTIVP